MIYAENILLCIVVPFVVSLLFIRGEEARRYVGAFLLGMGASLVSAYISSFVGSLARWQENETSIFIAPMVEETVKLLILLFFVFLIFPKDNTLVMLAVAIGAGFATFENCCYILTFGADSIAYILVRGLAVGVMHTVSILSLTIWLIFTRQKKAFSFPTVVGGLSLAMIYHSLYNLLVSEPGISRTLGYLLPILSVGFIYPLYKRTIK